MPPSYIAVAGCGWCGDGKIIERRVGSGRMSDCRGFPRLVHIGIDSEVVIRLSRLFLTDSTRFSAASYHKGID